MAYYKTISQHYSNISSRKYNRTVHYKLKNISNPNDFITRSKLYAIILTISLANFCGDTANAKSSKSDRVLLSLSPSELQSKGTAALLAKDSLEAAGYFGEAVSRNPLDAGNQTLLALSYQLQGQASPQALELALAGYDLAARAEPGQFWPAALAGRAAFDQGRYSDALNQFSRAALIKPADARILGAIAASAYLAGDVAIADMAARRAVAMDPAAQPAVLTMAAIAATANGTNADHFVARLAPAAQSTVKARLAQIAQTAPLDQTPELRTDRPASSPVGAEPPANQISLDVAIILSQNTQRSRTGLNLLDGLSIQYGGGFTYEKRIQGSDGNPSSRSNQKVLTTAITVPQLRYNLNLFSRGGQQYSVVARPQLTAYKGEQSEFFVGRTQKVAVGGINSGSIEQIDIGIELKVTPIEITPDGTKVRIETTRSFVTPDPAGSFAEVLTMFRQKVAATAEIRFGETLLLSGLTESVEDRTTSKTPILGDIPIVGLGFKESSNLKRNDSVMVLVTPARSVSLAGRPFARPEHAGRLTEFWSRVIDPTTNAAAALANFGRQVLFTRMIRSDVVMPLPEPGALVSEVVEAIGADAATAGHDHHR